MRTQADKAARFRELHQRSGAFIIPNPWDAGTAKLLAAMGFEALATTSLGVANTLGQSTISLDAIIENCRVIAEATDLPVNADLENCGADDPTTAAKAIARAPKPASSAARLRIRPAIASTRSTTSRSRSSGCRRRSKRHGPCRSRSR